jgi:hypothetical protein
LFVLLSLLFLAISLSVLRRISQWNKHFSHCLGNCSAHRRSYIKLIICGWWAPCDWFIHKLFCMAKWKWLWTFLWEYYLKVFPSLVKPKAILVGQY